MSNVNELTLADKEIIGVVLAAAITVLVKIPRPVTGFPQSVGLDILSLEIWSSSAITISSDGVNGVIIPANEHHFINCRYVADKADPAISETFVVGPANLNVIAHARRSAYADLG
jgi:hypothetical protein